MLFWVLDRVKADFPQQFQIRNVAEILLQLISIKGAETPS